MSKAIVRAGRLLAVAVCFAAFGTVQAQAARVLVGFGDSYGLPGGASSTHAGIDVELQAGESLVAPWAGAVKFVGRIPAAGGGTCTCVTLTRGAESLSLFPLSDVVLAKGQAVSPGDPLGSVADCGDGSTPGNHVHVGLRQGDLYEDPTPLLGALVAAPTAPEAPAAESAVVRARTVPADARPTAATSGTVVLSSAGAVASVLPAQSGAAVREGAKAGAGVASGALNGVGAHVGVGPGELNAPLRVRPNTGSPQRRGQTVAADSPLVSLARVLSGEAARRTRWLARSPRDVFDGLIAVLCGLAAAAWLLAGRRWNQLPDDEGMPVSDPPRIVLQHPRAGDTLRGLTSCSGPLPSQSRGH